MSSHINICYTDVDTNIDVDTKLYKLIFSLMTTRTNENKTDSYKACPLTKLGE